MKESLVNHMSWKKVKENLKLPKTFQVDLLATQLSHTEIITYERNSVPWRTINSISSLNVDSGCWGGVGAQRGSIA